jgi:hypothetical protein
MGRHRTSRGDVAGRERGKAEITDDNVKGGVKVHVAVKVKVDVNVNVNVNVDVDVEAEA